MGGGMNGNAYYIGLDVGGTTMKACVVDSLGKPATSVSMATEPERGQEAGLATMCETIRRAAAAAGKSMADIAGIGVATPGTMDIGAGLILDPPNLKPWRNVPVRQHVHDHFKIPTAFQNDANAAAYGEYWVGAGREVKSMVLFTLGTGVGGGIILDDKVLEGQHSHGGEIGHMCIDYKDGRFCGCGRRGCLEAYASATAVVKRAREEMPTDPSSALHTMLAEGGEELSARSIFIAAIQGDALALKIVDDTAFFLGVGAMNMMHVINPDAIVFAGGMTAAGEPFLNRVRHHIKRLAFPVPAERTLIRYAQLGSDAGFIGAAACAKFLVEGKL
jgi:glucokinase